jgi:hypothetical protein
MELLSTRLKSPAMVPVARFQLSANMIYIVNNAKLGLLYWHMP